jgi:hypothetical protein
METPYPSNSSALDPSLAIVPVRPDAKNSTPIDIPDPASIVSWTGKFSGQLVASPVTRFSLYFNQALFPGWQLDPVKAPNTVTIRFVYDFDSDGTPDRVEIVQNVPMVVGNCFPYQSKVTEYYTDQYFGGANGTLPVFIGIKNEPGGSAPFPSVVINGTLTVQIYAGSGSQPLFATPISVDVDPSLNRASWVQPPYEARTRSRIHELAMSKCASDWGWRFMPNQIQALNSVSAENGRTFYPLISEPAFRHPSVSRRCCLPLPAPATPRA